MTDDELIGFVPVAALIALAVRYEGLATVLIVAAALVAVLAVVPVAGYFWRRTHA